MLQEFFSQLRPELAPAEQQGYDTSRIYLLLDELLSNVHRHGYSERDGEPIGVRVRAQGDRVQIVVRDMAPTFDSATYALTRTAPPPSSGATGGMGLFIIYSMCESFVHMKLPRRGASSDGEINASRDATVRSAGH
jgi:anti-sigma regulatory factor (Ser/Thr protein kinase)